MINQFKDQLFHAYSNNIFNKKIVIFGVVPPPLGGVSVHINRVSHKLKTQKNKTYYVKTEFRGRKFLLPLYLIKNFIYLFLIKPDIVFYHSLCLPNSLWEVRFLVLIKKFFNYKVALIEHNCRHIYKRAKKEIATFNNTLEQVDQFIFIGKTSYESYIDNQLYIPKNYSIESAFLPPDKSQEIKIVKTYPKDLDQFIKTHRPLIAANASHLSLFNGKDLYGFDKCIEALDQLKKEYTNIGLILALAAVNNEKYFKKLQKLINDFGVNNNIYFMSNQRELWPLLKKVDLFVRPTLSDTDGISIHESILLKIPVVASNVCRRPKKAVIFDINKPDDFVDKISKTLNSTMKNKNYSKLSKEILS